MLLSNGPSRLIGGGRWTPATPTSGGVLPWSWLKADALALSDGDAIATWTDSSGNGKHATQSDAALRPVYRANVVGSLPVVRFDGLAQYFAVAFGALGSFSLFFVGRKSNAGTQSALLEGTGSILYNTTAQVRMVDAGLSPSVIWSGFDTALHVMSAVAIASTSKAVWRNGAGGTTGAQSGAGFSPRALGNGLDTTGRLWAGDMCELLLYKSALATADRQQVERYLGAKWGIAVA